MENSVGATGAANPTLTASFSGFVNGDTAAVLSGAPILSTTATTSSPASVYPITVSQGPLAAANYTFAFDNGTLSVIGTPSVTIASSSVLTAVSGGYQAAITVTNTGTTSASNVSLTAATLGSDAGSMLPQRVATLGSGAFATFTVTFPASVGSPGAAVAERYSGTYTGGTFAGSIRSTTLP